MDNLHRELTSVRKQCLKFSKKVLDGDDFTIAITVNPTPSTKEKLQASFYVWRNNGIILSGHCIVFTSKKNLVSTIKETIMSKCSHIKTSEVTA